MKFFSLMTTALLVFIVSSTMATWSFFLMVVQYAFAMFSLPFDSWERAKEIAQQLAEETD